ncbi:MAG: TRAP transporter large permease subunit [Azospirillaceae bacterium]
MKTQHADMPRGPAFRRPVESSRNGLAAILETATVILLIVTVIVAVLQVFFRYVLNDSLSWPEELVRWCFVWMVFLGLPLGIARDSHINIDLVSRRLEGRAKEWHWLSVQGLIAAGAIALVRHGADLVVQATYVSPALGLPFTYLFLALPVGAALTLIFQATRGADGLRGFGTLTILVGVAGYLLLAYALPGVAGRQNATLILLVLALVMVLWGTPIVFALALASFAAIAPRGELMLLTLPQQMTGALDSFLLLAIPFFILAAAAMNAGGITEKLLGLASSLVGHLRGGLGHVNILTNAMMAGVSGSSMADAAAISKTLVPTMERHGYTRSFACALTAASSVLANLIPPSLALIIFGALASVSVGALFVAALVPAAVVCIALAIVVHVMSGRQRRQADMARASWTARGRALVAALPALVLPLIVVGGLRAGAFTPSEAGAIAVVYALICGALFYRHLGPRRFVAACREAVGDAVAVMCIIAAAAPFAWVLVSDQVPQTVAAALAAAFGDPLTLLLVLNLFLLIVGLFMEMIAAMVILVPILIPIITAAGIDPVHFGVVLVMNLVIGALTPPLGMLIFTTSRVAKAEVPAVFRAVVPFLIGLVAALLLVTLVPGVSLGLVDLLG